MTILDSVLILFLLCGAVLGFKKGAIRSLVALIGTILVVIVAYYLKNPVADIFFKFVPFFQFGGPWSGLVTLNILLYEAVSYALCFLVLYSVLNIFLKVSGIIEKILTFTIILGIPSKIIGALLGFIEAVIFSFLALFVLMQGNFTNELVMDSKVANTILDKTPVIGNIANDTYQAVKDIQNLTEKYKDVENKDAYNQDILRIMLERKVVTTKDVEKLIENKKLKFNGVQEVVNQFKEKEKTND